MKKLITLFMLIPFLCLAQDPDTDPWKSKTLWKSRAQKKKLEVKYLSKDGNKELLHFRLTEPKITDSTTVTATVFVGSADDLCSFLSIASMHLLNDANKKRPVTTINGIRIEYVKTNGYPYLKVFPDKDSKDFYRYTPSIIKKLKKALFKYCNRYNIKTECSIIPVHAQETKTDNQYNFEK